MTGAAGPAGLLLMDHLVMPLKHVVCLEGLVTDGAFQLLSVQLLGGVMA